MGLLSAALHFPEAPSAAWADKEVGKAECRQHPAAMFCRCSWHIQKPCPWAPALVSTWFEATGGAHRKALEPESAPGPMVAQPMEEPPHLLPGCVPSSAGNGFVPGRRGDRTTGCVGGPGLLVVLSSWAVLQGGRAEETLSCFAGWGGAAGPRACDRVAQSAGTRGTSSVPISRSAGGAGGSSRLSELAPALLQVAMRFWVF